MIRLVTRGRFTHDYVKALIGAPEDREPAVRKLIEEAESNQLLYDNRRNRFLAHFGSQRGRGYHRRADGSIGRRHNFSREHCQSLDRCGVQGSGRESW